MQWRKNIVMHIETNLQTSKPYLQTWSPRQISFHIECLLLKRTDSSRASAAENMTKYSYSLSPLLPMIGFRTRGVTELTWKQSIRDLTERAGNNLELVKSQLEMIAKTRDVAETAGEKRELKRKEASPPPHPTSLWSSLKKVQQLAARKRFNFLIHFKTI